MSDGDRRELGEQWRVLGLVPICRELIWRSDDDGLFVHRNGLRRLKPCFKRLFRQFVPSSVQDSRPDFSRREHSLSEACGKTGQAGRRRYRRHVEKANALHGGPLYRPSKAASLLERTARRWLMLIDLCPAAD